MMKRHTTSTLLVALALLLVAPVITARSKKGNIANALADKRKAEYILLNAQRAKNDDNGEAYFDLLNYAYNVDTTNTTAAFYLGFNLITMEGSTFQDAMRALPLIKKHYLESPGDRHETTLYGDLCSMLGRNDEAIEALEKLDSIIPNDENIQNRLAEAYKRVGDYRKAILTYDTIEALHDKSLSTTTNKSACYFALGDTTGAISVMHSLLDEAPNNVLYNISMAGVMSLAQMNDSAIYYLDRAVVSEPDNGLAYMTRAQFYLSHGDSARYDEEVYKALQTENLDVEAKVDVLNLYIRELLSGNDSTERINKLLDVLVEQHPHEVTIRKIYSEYLVFRNNYKGAVEQLGYALDVNPTDADSWRRLMLINMMDENFPAAIAAAEKALTYNPDSLDLYRYIAPSYYQMKEYDKALATYDMALERVDSLDLELRSDLIGGKADVYFSLGDTLKAFETYEEALDIFPANTGVMNNYAYYLSLSDRDLDKAERMAAMAVKYNPDNATYLDTYAWVFFKKHDYNMALTYIKAAIDNDDSGMSDIFEHYGDILFMMGEPEQAVEQWKKALEAAPDNELLQRKVKHRTYFYQ